MADKPTNPRPAPGFRPVDLNDCNEKCKCHFGTNKGKAYNKDQPCYAKDGFDEDTCTCSAYPVGVNFYQQVPKTKACMGIPEGDCCCGKWGIYEASGSGASPICDTTDCENSYVQCEPGCVYNTQVQGPGIIVDYEQPFVINKPSPHVCEESTCPTQNGACSQRRTWNEALGVSVDYVVTPSTIFPFYFMYDAKKSGGTDDVGQCCPGSYPNSDVYGNCYQPLADIPTCKAPVQGVGRNAGFLSSPALEATVLISGEEKKVLYFSPVSTGYVENTPVCRDLIAVSLKMQSDALTEASPEFIYGDADKLEAVNRGACKTDAECGGPTDCPDDGTHGVCTASGCVRSVCWVFGGCVTVDNPRHWWPPCWSA